MLHHRSIKFLYSFLLLFSYFIIHAASSSDNPTAAKLTQQHIPSLLQQLKNHASKWREIGIHLGFLLSELSNIEARPNLMQSAPTSWLSALLEEWIQWAPEDSRGSTDFAKMEDLKNALKQAGLAATAHDLKLH